MMGFPDQDAFIGTGLAESVVEQAPNKPLGCAAIAAAAADGGRKVAAV